MKRKRYVAVDSETFLIRPGRIAPPLVCVSWAERVDGVLRSGLLDHVEGLRFVRSLLEDPDVVLVFHNAAFDLAVFAAEDPTLLPLIFRALAEGRIADTMIREQLIMIARGDMSFQAIQKGSVEDEDADDEDDTGESAGWKRIKKNYTLAGLTAHYLRRKLDKGEEDGDEAARLTFDRWRGIPIHLWPERHRAYAMDDGLATLEVFELQAPTAPITIEDPIPKPILEQFVSPDERMQVCAAFALHLCAVHGVRTDPVALAKLEKKLTAMQEGLGAKLRRAGLLRLKNDRSGAIARLGDMLDRLRAERAKKAASKRTKAGTVEKLDAEIAERSAKLAALHLAQDGDAEFSRNMGAIRALVAKTFLARGEAIPLTDSGIEAKEKGELINIEKHVSTSKDTIEAAAHFPYPDGLETDDRPLWLAGMTTQEKTPDGKRERPGLDVDTFEEIRARHDAAGLEPLVAFANCQKVMGTYWRPMHEAAVAGIPMNSRPSVLVETGRTSWGAMNVVIDGKKKRIGGNLQNLPRMPGVRECIVPRRGFVLCSVDYDSIELRTLAEAMVQICGRSTLAERYRKDPNYDPHTSFAAKMLHISYEEGMRLKAAGDKKLKQFRQMAKAANFGLPGGSSAKTFVNYAWKAYGVRISEREAEHLKEVWFSENPEMRQYFAFISSKVEAAGDRGATFTAFGTGRKRGGTFFTNGANYFFQSAAADGGKLALFAVSWEAYCDPTSPLFGSRPLVFIHDEILLEVPEERAHEAAQRVVTIMEEQMARIIPHVPPRASPALSRVWLKSAEAAYDDAGRLIPWEDRQKGKVA